ncbi:hypothetical protein GCM10022297_06470 [Lactobacillus hamsteri]|uniref:Uncharacterized protein n=1 Tax=Lactobacillus hamsteri DSM 5661 = JCM 6256 TaxID=1423754 RepID=A0A0R1YDD6_9LACO|nr:hypothetical protein [Lactobacillus hamsteri]KRM40381.1 hypothetical protein FC39_GL000656 [Lactobacillus hamsteri DSM 5661 = JCM 6256]
MLSILLILFLAWLFFKLGIGMIKIIFFLIIAGITAVFFAYLLIPLIAILAIGGLVWAVVS